MPASRVMSRKCPWPSFSKSRLPPRTVVTNKSGSPSLSMSAKAAETLMRPGTPTPASACLAYEVDVVQPIAVYVRDSDSVSVVVVGRLIVACRVIDDAIHEGDSALLELIFKLKLIEHLELIDGFQLLLFSRG